MLNGLYNQYSAGDLIDPISQKIDALTSADINAPSAIAVRRDALQTLSVYPYKNAKGEPLPAPLNEDVENGLLDIAVSSDEARQLGVNGKRVAVQLLLRLTSAKPFSTDPQDAVKCSYAAYLLAQGTRHEDRLDEYLEQSSRQYQLALKAFGILAGTEKAINPQDAALAEQGRAILHQLQKVASSIRQTVLLSEAEYSDLQAGRIGKIDGNPMDPTEQFMRQKINDRVTDARVFEASPDLPFKAVLDPPKLSTIKDLMRSDTTSAWLLEEVNAAQMPIILYEYLVPDHQLPNQIIRAHYYVTSFDRNHISLYVNKADIYQLASACAHEARHFWQFSLVMSLTQLSFLSPIDNIIYSLLREADAHTIQKKATWGMHKNANGAVPSSAEQRAFQQVYTRTHGTTMPVRVKKACQDLFIDWLEQQLRDRNYLSGFVAEERDRGQLAGEWKRAIPDSQLLTHTFLHKLSQVGKTAHYLDAASADAIRKLLIERLPSAIAEVETVPSGAAYKHG